VKTSCGASPSKEGCLMLNLFTVSWVAMMASVSLGRVWQTKVPLRVAFFFLVEGLKKDSYHKQFQKWHVIVVNRCCM